MGAIHSPKISRNSGSKLNGSVRSNRKSFEKTGPPFEVDHFSRSDLACVASVSARVRRESRDDSKKKRNDGGGGKAQLETLATQARSDWSEFSLNGWRPVFMI